MLEPSLTLKVIDYVFDHIRKNQLSSGEDLPSEIQTCNDLNISRGAVREAFRSLEVAGLIAKENGRSPKVGVLNSEYVTHLFVHALQTRQVSLRQTLELRAAIEVTAAGLAARRRTRSDVENLRTALAGMMVSAEQFDDFVQYDLEFHNAVSQATGNPLIAFLGEAMRESMKASMYEGLNGRWNREEVLRVVEFHSAIADAIARENARDAELRMKKHFDETLRAVNRSNIHLGN